MYSRDQRGLLNRVECFDSSGDLLSTRSWDLDERGFVRRALTGLFRDPGGPISELVTEVWNDATGRPERIREPTGHTRARVYSATGALVEERDSEGTRVRWELDAAGRCVRTELTERHTSGGRDSARWLHRYNSRGLLEEEIDPLDNSTLYKYDARGLLTSARNANGEVLWTDYDAHKDPLLFSSAAGKTQMARDSGGRVERVIDPGRRRDPAQP